MPQAKSKAYIGTASTTVKAKRAVSPAPVALPSGRTVTAKKPSRAQVKRLQDHVEMEASARQAVHLNVQHLTEADVRRIVSDFQTAGASGQNIGRTTDNEPRVGSQLIKAVPRTTTNDLLSELETQISIMRSAFGDLQGRIESVLGPAPLDASCSEKAPEPSVSHVNERLSSFIKDIQSTTTWINYVRERVEL